MEKWRSLEGNLKRHHRQLPLDHPPIQARRQRQVHDQGHDRLHPLEARPPEVVVLLQNQGNLNWILTKIKAYGASVLIFCYIS